MTCYRAFDQELEQALILRDVTVYFVELEGEGTVAAKARTFAFLVVLTQDCDVQFDRLARRSEPDRPGGQPVSKDKQLNGLVVCPAFPRDDVFSGDYVDGASEWRGTRKNILETNREDRYHVLPAEPPMLAEAIALDFKLAFSISPEYLERWRADHPSSSVATLDIPWRDRLVQRYVQYFGRIAEPDED